MTWETDDVELVPIHELLPHEETKSKNQQKTSPNDHQVGRL